MRGACQILVQNRIFKAFEIFDHTGSFDSAPARPAKEAGRKFFAGAPLRMTPHIHE
jgi:hypothetical protein